MEHTISVVLTDIKGSEVGPTDRLRVEDREDRATGGEIITLNFVFNSNQDFDEKTMVSPFDAWIHIYFPSRRKVLRELARYLRRNSFAWIIPGYDRWQINLDCLAAQFPSIQQIEWGKGFYWASPTVERKARRDYWGGCKFIYAIRFTVYDPDFTRKREEWEDSLAARRRAEQDIAMDMGGDENKTNRGITPVEIERSLIEFRRHTEAKPCAFVMMKFSRSRVHQKIIQAIRKTLEPHGITALRADDREYHPDLYYNILTYIHGCHFGVAVYERLESNDFNPNVSLEVGILLGLGKPVCLLKDSTLPGLHTDLMGKLYRTFDPQSPVTSIPNALESWLRDKELV
jgi:hypothetical protein